MLFFTFKLTSQKRIKYFSTVAATQIQYNNPQPRNSTKYLQLVKLTQLLTCIQKIVIKYVSSSYRRNLSEKCNDKNHFAHTHGQWWSIFNTHVPQTLQWCARSGLITKHLSQYRSEPFIVLSIVAATKTKTKIHETREKHCHFHFHSFTH